MFKPTPTWSNFDFDKLFIWIGANNDQIWLRRGYMNDFEQCSNWLQFDLISLLVHFWYEFWQIMTRYDFLEARWVILSNVWTDFWYFFVARKPIIKAELLGRQASCLFLYILWPRQTSVGCPHSNLHHSIFIRVRDSISFLFSYWNARLSFYILFL